MLTISESIPTKIMEDHIFRIDIVLEQQVLFVIVTSLYTNSHEVFNLLPN